MSPRLLTGMGVVLFAGATSLSGWAGEGRANYTALEVDRAAGEVAAEAVGDRSLWPGFDPLAAPLAVYDGQETFLFRHPSPPAGFAPVAGAEPGIHGRPGRHERVVANTNVEIGGVSTATLLLDLFPAEASLRGIAAVAIHELFHVFQRRHHPHWVANEAQLFTYPVASADLLALRRQETEALRRALTAEDEAGCARWSRLAVAIRRARLERLAPEFGAYERGTELNEGLARYVEMRAAGRTPLELPAAGFAAADVRGRAYTTGAAWGLLLDRLGGDWKARLSTDAALTLDTLLAEALGDGDTGALEPATVDALEHRARAEVAELVAERTEVLAKHETRPGWRIEVQVGEGGGALWPQGFDPLNVIPLDPRRTLHTRFLRLGNERGEMEVMNQRVLTEGAGEHPLFNGVRRVLITGLAEPQVTKEEGQVTVRAPGVTLRFQDAVVRQEPAAVVVELAR